MPNRILVIDDDADTLDLMRVQLELEGYQVSTSGTGQEGLELVATQPFDVILTDLQLPDLDGLEIVKKCKELTPETEIIVITGYGSVEKALNATRAGAFFFLEKPVEFEEVQVLLDKALERKRQTEEIKVLRGRLTARDSYLDIIGGSKPMQDLYEIIDSVAESDANILILGESGTGKELIANAIHYKSLRAKKPFVKVNCSALPKDLIESELFGHVRGAFTGANSDKTGLIGQASGGSLLLDEIGEMPLELQPKLLRVLQERVFQRLGSEKPLTADFRLICSTNRDPLEAVQRGLLREDLYYRINTIELRIPPLRERVEDILRMADHFLKIYAEKYNRPARTLSHSAYASLLAYNWPGNVRELQNAIERAVLICKGETIAKTNLPQPIWSQSNNNNGVPATLANPSLPSLSLTSALTNQTQVNAHDLGALIVNQVPDPQPGNAQPDIFEQLESVIVSAALKRTKGNKQAAANLLGLHRPRLYSIIKRHNLDDC